MPTTKRLYKLCVMWLVCVTMLLGALLPSFAQTLHAISGNQTWVELCSPSGMTRLVALDTGVKSDPEISSSNHCIWCSLHASALDLPPPALSVAAVSPRILILAPRAFSNASHTLFIWRTTPARGPPSLS